MRVLITGATGLVGKAICQVLAAEGHSLVALSRRPDRVRDWAAGRLYRWEPEAEPAPAEAVDGVEAIIHLAGEPVAAGRWTAEQKQRIRLSRLLGTRNLVAGLSAATSRPRVLVSASAVGFYGDRGDERLEESASPGQGFLSQVCQEWEREAEQATAFGLRVVRVRIGVVLSPAGGALPRMLPPFKFGVGGRLGSGRQWFPWIHLDDVVGLFRHALRSGVSGPVNAAAPHVVTNAEFTRALAAVLRRPAFLPVPELALRLALGEMADVLLSSQRVVPKVALETGYQFRYVDLAAALDHLLGQTRSAGVPRRAHQG